MNYLKLSRRYLSANARYELPAFAGEPFKHYIPGSQEAINLTLSLKKFKSEIIDIPCIINGKEYFTGDIQEQVTLFLPLLDLISIVLLLFS